MGELLLRKYANEYLKNTMFNNLENLLLDIDTTHIDYNSNKMEQIYEYQDYISTIEYMYEKFSNAIVYADISREFSHYTEEF